MKKDWDKIELIKQKTVEDSSFEIDKINENHFIECQSHRMINCPLQQTQNFFKFYDKSDLYKQRLNWWGVYLRTYIEIYPEDEHHEERVKALEYYNEEMKRLGLKAE